MLTIKTHIWFDEWIDRLKDERGRTEILRRIRRFQLGATNDVKYLGDGVSEMRIHIGPGYRVYYTRIGQTVYLLIGGGDKSTQSRDIARAIEIASDLKDLQP
jgi:putative addiction module killer protein